MTTMMKAIRIHAYGGSDVLAYDEVPRPVPGQGEILVRIHAASVNPVDWKIRAGLLKEYRPFVLPIILGFDISGTVEAMGPGTNVYKVKDEVFAMVDPARGGGYAEYVAVQQSLLSKKPKGVDHVHAAAVPLAGLTAFHGLFQYGKLQPGQKVLIHGAAGGVGSFAVQLAKWKGAEVVGTASTAHQSALKELGVDQAVDYTTAAFEKAVSQVDLVIDTIGGITQEKSFSVLKKGGILASTVGMPSLEKAAAAGVTAVAIQNRPSGEALSEMAKLMEARKLKSIVEKIFPLSEVRKAHELSETGHVRGKIVLKVV